MQGGYIKIGDINANFIDNIIVTDIDPNIPKSDKIIYSGNIIINHEDGSSDSLSPAAWLPLEYGGAHIHTTVTALTTSAGLFYLVVTYMFDNGTIYFAGRSNLTNDS